MFWLWDWFTIPVMYGHVLNIFLGNSCPIKQRTQKIFTIMPKYCVQSFVSSLFFWANHIVKEHLGMVKENQTAFSQGRCTSHISNWMLDYCDFYLRGLCILLANSVLKMKLNTTNYFPKLYHTTVIIWGKPQRLII